MSQSNHQTTDSNLNKHIDELVIAISSDDNAKFYPEVYRPAITKLIEQESNRARIDELKAVAEQSDNHMAIPNGATMRRQYITDRLAQLESGQDE